MSSTVRELVNGMLDLSLIGDETVVQIKSGDITLVQTTARLYRDTKYKGGHALSLVVYARNTQHKNLFELWLKDAPQKRIS